MSSRWRHRNRITWAKWRVFDPFDRERYMTFYVSVYEPTWEMPYASLLIRATSGNGSMFHRFASVDDLLKVYVVPEGYVERLREAIIKAEKIADDIHKDMRLAMNRRQLAKGGQIVRTDTGEILAEAERILSDGYGLVED